MTNQNSGDKLRQHMLLLILTMMKDSVDFSVLKHVIGMLLTYDSKETGGKGLAPLAIVAFMSSVSDILEKSDDGKEFVKKMSDLSEELVKSKWFEEIYDSSPMGKKKSTHGFEGTGMSEEDMKEANEFMNTVFNIADDPDDPDGSNDSDEVDFSIFGSMSKQMKEDIEPENQKDYSDKDIEDLLRRLIDLDEDEEEEGKDSDNTDHGEEKEDTDTP